MNIDLQIKTIEEKVIALISSDPDSFLVEVKIKPGNNVKVFVDADHGVSIDKLATLNRNLYKKIDEERIFQNNDFSLEISSPGLDEPLKLQRQYVKNIGRYIEVILKNGIKKEGKLISATDDEFVIEEEKGNKKVKEFAQSPIFYNEVKTTKIQIKF